MVKRKIQSPQLGYNNNVTYEGKVYHVQTEDSGIEKPHVITHLFSEGVILATRKCSYDHLLEDPDIEEKVRKLMREQHKAMFIALRDGTYQDDRSETAAPAPSPAKPAGPDTAKLSPTRATSKLSAPQPRQASKTRSGTSRHAAVPDRKGPEAPPKPAAASVKDLSKTATGLQPAGSSSAEGRILPARPSRPPDILGKRPSPPPRVNRPKDIFAIQQPENEGFGEDLITERSLDEVIMEFLSDDLDES